MQDQRTKKHVFLGFVICFLFVGSGIINTFSHITFTHNEFTSSAPVSANISPIQEYLFQTQNFTYFLNNACHPSGGFPGKGSDIENTWYAARLMQLLNNFSLIDLDSLEGFIVNHQQPDGGLTFEDGQNGTLLETYRAVNTLELIGHSVSSLNLTNMRNFLNASVINQTFFRKDLSHNDTSIEVNYAGLQLANALGVNLESINLNQSLLWEQLLSDFSNSIEEGDYGFFSEPGQPIYRSTFYALQCLDLLGKLNANRSLSTSIQVIPEIGTILEGNNDSISSIDSDRIMAESIGNEVNLSFAVSLDNLLDDFQDEFGFVITLNCSQDPVQNATLLLFNTADQSWENVTGVNTLQTLNEQTFYIQTTALNTSEYLNYSLSNFNRGIEARLHVKDTVPFNLSVNRFQANFTVFNNTRVAEVVNSSFSLSGGYFESQSITENYYALAILTYLNYTANPLVSDKDLIRDFVLEFSVQDGLFVGAPLNEPKYLDVTLASTFYSNSVLNLTDSINDTIGNCSLQFLLDWVMPDGGFGGPSSLSLSHTYYYIEYLYQTNSLSSDIRNRVRNFTLGCQIQSSGVGYSFSDDFEATSISSDTFYALKIFDIIDNLQNIPHLQEIGAYFINRQVEEGYFFLLGLMEDIYFALNVISLTATTQPLNDVSALIQFINAQQGGSGGYYQQKNGETRVQSTSLILEAAKKMNILQNLHLYYTLDKGLGAVDYLRLHQNVSTGGFFEEQDDIFGESYNAADIETTFLLVRALDSLNLITEINEKSLLAYVLSSVTYFNDVGILESASGEKYSYIQGSLDRIQLYLSHSILEHWKLGISVAVNPRTAVPDTRVEMNLNLTDPSGNLLEGGLIGVFQDSLGVGVSFKDHQNGSYGCELTTYAQPGVYNVTITCNHSLYIGFSQKFRLTINDLFAEENMELNRRPLLLFSSSVDFSVHLVNDSSGDRVIGASVQLLDSSGAVAFSLEDAASTGTYAARLDFSGWLVGDYEYTLCIQKEGFRTETYSIIFSVYPTWFIILLLAGIIIGIILCVIGIKRRTQVRKVLRRVGAKITGKKIGFQQMQVEDSSKPSETSEKKNESEQPAKKGGVDYA